MSAEPWGRCPDCGGLAPDLELHRKGCSRYQARLAEQAEARRPRELRELGRDGQLVALASWLRRKGGRRMATPPSDDQCLEFALRNGLDDPEVLRLAHALCRSKVRSGELHEAARLAHQAEYAEATVFELLGYCPPEVPVGAGQ